MESEEREIGISDNLTATLAAETGIQIVHEIHRGKFSFHPLAICLEAVWQTVRQP
jgi:hypothetical protein